MTAQLTDLDVDRVDAVDRPATRRKFLITKAEGDPPAGDPVADAKRLLAAAAKAIGMIHKSASEHPAEMADALNELAEASGATERFTKAAPVEPPKEPAAKAETPALDPDVFAAALAKAIGPVIGESVVKALKADLEKDESGDSAATTRGNPEPAIPASKQDPEPVAKRAPRGVDFSNLVFGRSSGLNG